MNLNYELDACLEIQVSSKCLEIEGITKQSKTFYWGEVEYVQEESSYSYKLWSFNITPIPIHIEKLLLIQDDIDVPGLINISLSQKDLWKWREEIQDVNVTNDSYQDSLVEFILKLRECSDAFALAFEPQCDQIDMVLRMTIDQIVDWITKNIVSTSPKGGVLISS